MTKAEPVQPAEVGLPAPTFQLDSSQGPVRLDQYRGKPTVIFFMREFSCALCQSHVREMKRLSGQHPQAQFLVVGGGSVTQARQLAERFKLAFPVLADPDRQTYARYDLGKSLGVWQRSGTAVIDTAGQLKSFVGSFSPLSSFSETEVKRTLDGL